MKLSIIVTSYKNPELLKVCLNSIKKNLILTDFEIIVVDSATEERSELMMKEYFPEIKFIPSEKNIGFGRLVKKGYNTSQGEFILILNGDIIVKDKAIERLLNYIENNPKVGIVGPKLLNFNTTLQYSCLRFPTPLTIIYRRTFLGRLWFAKKNLDSFLMKEFNHQEEKEVDWLMGSALMTSRKAIKKVGLMNEKFKMYFEDTDWCRRFWDNGWKIIYLPTSEMYHYHGRGSVGKGVIQSLLFNKLTWIHIKSAIIFFGEYLGKPLPKHN